MSNLKTLSGGYKGGSPRVRSENSKAAFVDTRLKVMNAQGLVDNIKAWYSEGRITTEGLQQITTQLQELCQMEAVSHQNQISTLESQAQDLATTVAERQAQLDAITAGEDIVATINALTAFFGAETIEKIKNQ
jgi:hypothetical protein